MRAILEFNLPDDTHDLHAAIKSSDLVSVIWDTDQELRGWLKHGHPFATADEALEKVREMLWERIRDHDLVSIIEH